VRRARGFLRKLRIRFGSLRLRLMLVSAALAMLFMLLLMPVLQGVFLMALEQTVAKRLASDAAALISAARIQDGICRTRCRTRNSTISIRTCWVSSSTVTVS
jgi:two-component system sensor histidine kinase PhoQ